MKQTWLLIVLAAAAPDGAASPDRSPRSKPAPAATRPQTFAESAANKNAFTERDARKSLLAWLRRVRVEGYKRVGHRDPAWDKDVIALLDRSARTIIYQRDAEGMLSRQESFTITSDLIQRKCTDPQVLFFHAQNLTLRGKWKEAEGFARQSLKAYRASKYPRILWNRTATILYQSVAKQPGKSFGDTNPLVEQVASLYFDAAADDSFLDGEQGIFYDEYIRAIFGRMPFMRKRAYETITANPKVDPWVRNMVAGQYHTIAAWEARGGRPGRSVKPDQRKGFFEHLRLAEKHLLEAYRLKPRYPEAAVVMIQVATGQQKGLEERRMWFDRAVARHFDHGDAYRTIRWALLPRWGGSRAGMYAFGLECLATRRFDTKVPLQFFDILRDLRKEEGAAVWDRPDVYKHIKELFTGYAAAGDSWSVLWQNWFKSLHAACAWQCGKMLDAKRLVRKLGDDLDMKAFKLVGADLKEVREKLLR